MDTEELESRFLALFWRKQLSQWENYVDDAHHDLSAIDAQIYALLSSPQLVPEIHSRREQVLRAIVTRGCVDTHPDVAQLRNRLDDWDNYTAGIESLHGRSPVRFREFLGQRMTQDVLELMQRRRHPAREQGFGSYPELVLWSEDLQLQSVRAVLLDQIKAQLPTAVALAKAHGVSWPSWHEALASIGGEGNGGDPWNLALHILNCLGLGQVGSSISVLVKDQPIYGYAGIISVPDDIRILLGTLTGLPQEITLYHELGHAVAHALNRAPGIFKTWTSVYDETMAVVLERIATAIALDEAQQRAEQEIRLLEDTRCATSALFELALWEQPEAAEALYAQYYGAWELEMLPASAWAADSFRSVDPVYIHNYVIAARVADLTLEYLRQKYGDDFAAWGQWLTESYYADGRRRSLDDKLAALDEMRVGATHLG